MMNRLRTVYLDILFVAGCTILGVMFRLWGLGSRSLWGDEACTVLRIDQINAQAVIHDVKESPFPPLFYLLEQAIQWTASPTILSLRLLPFLAGILAIPLTFYGVRSMGGMAMARWATLMTATSAFHVHYSQDAKMYSLVWLLTLCSNLGFLNLMLNGPSRGWIAIYLVGMTLLPWTSYVGLVVHAVQAIWLLILAFSNRHTREHWPNNTAGTMQLGESLTEIDRNRVMKVALGQQLPLLAVLVGISSLPFVWFWAPVALQASVQRHGIGWVPPVGGLWPSILGFWETTASFLTGLHPSNSGLTTSSFRGTWIALTVLIVVISGVLIVLATRQQDLCAKSLSVYWLVWWAAPLIGCLVFSAMCYSLFGIPRFLTSAAPGLFLLIAAAASSHRAGRFLGITVVMLNLGSVAWSHGTQTRIPFHEIVELLDTQGAFQSESPILQIAKSPSCEIPEIALESAVSLKCPQARIAWVHWGQYRQIRSGSPVLILHETANSRDLLSTSGLRRSLPEWSVIYRGVVHEHPLTAMADPSRHRQVELWSWIPPQD